MPVTSKLTKDLVDSGYLTPCGIFRLSQIIEKFCDENRYPLWRFNFEHHEESSIQTWCDGFATALADWTEVLVWQEKWPDADAITIHLSEGEYRASKLRIHQPSRDIWTLELDSDEEIHEKTEVGPVKLKKLLQSQKGIDALIYRLDKKCIAPYNAIDIPLLADETARNRMVWTWANQQSHPVALSWPDFSGLMHDDNTPPVLFPRAWGALEKCWSGCYGPLRLQGGHSIIVTNEAGKSGVIQLRDVFDPLLGDVAGYWMQPCTWGYLHGSSGDVPVCEAAQNLVPDSRGEVVCDLINAATGKRLNPDGIKVLTGTLEENGCIAINEATEGAAPKRVDRMNLVGELLHKTGVPATAGDLRWKDIWETWEGFQPVQSPQTNLWGFIDDKTGAVAITPQFADVGHFNQGLARAWPADDREKMGLINQQGHWFIPPVWRRIYPQKRRYFVVQDMNDCWGAIDERSNIITAIRPRQSWLAEPAILDIMSEKRYQVRNNPWQKTTEERERDILIEGIERHWHEKIRQWVIAAITTPPYTLAALEGVFDSDAPERDLRTAGIWGIKVRVLNDKTDGILQVLAGETGYIGTFHPVGLSCFDLSLETPIHGLPSHPEAVIGIPWKHLEVIHHE